MGNSQSRANTANEEPRTPSLQQDSAGLAQLFARNPENSDRDIESLEQRRNAKLEREARRTERDKVARENEREKSMKEESVDGGYLVTQGVYTGTEDFSKSIVRQLMVSRRMMSESLLNVQDRKETRAILERSAGLFSILDGVSVSSCSSR